MIVIANFNNSEKEVMMTVVNIIILLYHNVDKSKQEVMMIVIKMGMMLMIMR